MSTARAPERLPQRIPARQGARTPARGNTALAPQRRIELPQPYQRRTKPAPPPLRLVGRNKARRRAGALGLLVTMVVFASLFGAVVSSTWRVQSQQHLDQLDAKVTAAQTRYEKLRLEVAELESPQRIVDVATHRLGMVQPNSTTYLLPPATNAPAKTDDGNGGASESAQGDWTSVKPYLGAAP